MRKVSTDEMLLQGGGQNRLSKNRRPKYLKPGALAQIRNRKAACKSCVDVGKKRVAISGVKPPAASDSDIRDKKSSGESSVDLSPQRSQFLHENWPSGACNLPSTPCVADGNSDSWLESLPVDLLVKILCHLRHDQLKAVFHVSQKIRKAVILARQFHFNYTTPVRTRQKRLNTVAAFPSDQLPSISTRGNKVISIPSPHTPNAPKQGPRPPSHLEKSELRQVAAVLFPEPSFSTKCLVPSVLQKPICATHVDDGDSTYITSGNSSKHGGET